MGFNEFIGKLFGNKATRDMKEIKVVEFNQITRKLCIATRKKKWNGKMIC